ncbi:MAG TPA: cellulase family glycosylhydrolase [Candidatus Dormibacteraeota bacterium]|nr:cellulase family glycosylhydrolase [Candidatus Dormibacteraeota bacterium]
MSRRRRRVVGVRPQRRMEQRGRGPALWIALLLLPVAGIGWAYVPLAPLTTHVPAAHRGPATDGLPWISTLDGRMVDASGRTVLLRGFNVDALLEPSVRHSDLTEADAALMQRSGVTAVRLPYSWALLEPTRGAVDPAYLDRLAAAVDLLARHGIHTILALHIRDWSAHYGGSGAPDWASAAVVPDVRFSGFPGNWGTHLNPAMNAATTYFWLSPDWQADYAFAWRAVAGRFRDDSAVAGYDLYNEPHPLPIPPRIFEQQLLWPFYARLVDAVGAVDPNHLFLVEGVFLGDDGTSMRPVAAPDLVYAPHVYTGSLVPPAFDGTDTAPLQGRIAGQASEAAQLPAALFEGELGFDRSQPHAGAWADAALDALEDAGAGWAWWQWKESRAWGVVTADGAFVDTAWLAHLARPFLAAAPPGVAADGHGDGVHGTLRIRVAPTHGAGIVEVSWPSETLGDPATSGSCVASTAWTAATARLTMTLTRAAGCEVSVTRAPAGSAPT